MSTEEKEHEDAVQHEDSEVQFFSPCHSVNVSSAHPTTARVRVERETRALNFQSHYKLIRGRGGKLLEVKRSESQAVHLTMNDEIKEPSESQCLVGSTN